MNWTKSKNILSLDALTEKRVQLITQAIHGRDAAVAHKIMDSDGEIDEMEAEAG